ncbi:hypothetical protein C8J56DRAFT_899645 [Mycena floridula]|nr:hypothetical protein C8J56DRAFT_899645 [Mycena floridula]
MSPDFIYLPLSPDLISLISSYIVHTAPLKLDSAPSKLDSAPFKLDSAPFKLDSQLQISSILIERVFYRWQIKLMVVPTGNQFCQFQQRNLFRFGVMILAKMHVCRSRDLVRQRGCQTLGESFLKEQCDTGVLIRDHTVIVAFEDRFLWMHMMHWVRRFLPFNPQLVPEIYDEYVMEPHLGLGFESLKRESQVDHHDPDGAIRILKLLDIGQSGIAKEATSINQVSPSSGARIQLIEGSLFSIAEV